MKKPLFRILLALLALGAVGAGVVVWTRLRPIEVRVATEDSDLPVRVFGLGTVEARVLSRIGFEIGATIVELRADHGDIVRKGDILARLQATEQEAKVARAQAAMQNAEANIRKLEANLAKAIAVLAQRREANRRKQTLIGRGVVSEQAAEEAKRDEDVAKADVDIARSELEVARAVLGDARAQHAYEQTVLAQRTLIAPFDAIVVERSKELGSVIRAGDPIFTLVAVDSVWTLAYIDESRAGAITLGQPATIRLRSLPLQTFNGRVARIGIESDRVSEERRVYVKCDDCPPRFHLGEQAEVLITVARLDKGLFVPEAAVKGFDGRNGTIWTVEDGRLRRRAVTFGLRADDGRAQIVGGLPPGARVVAQLRDGMREGRAVRIADRAPVVAGGSP